MLSRVADALFWMSRYLERAEHIARMVDVTINLELDLRGVTTGSYDVHWIVLTGILQQPATFEGKYGDIPPREALTRWLTLDPENPNSIISAITKARSNARGIRGSINDGLWKEINKLYWLLRDKDFLQRAQESPHDLYQAVASGSYTFQGMCDATLTQDEGWHFIQLGKFMERSEKTLRILDIHHGLLQDLTDPEDMPISNLHWAGVLRMCGAYNAYQRMYVERVEASRLVNFLLTEPSFPRSVHYSLMQVADALTGIEGPFHRRSETGAERLIGRAISDLKFAEIDHLLNSGLHEFLVDLINRVSQVSRALQIQYSLP